MAKRPNLAALNLSSRASADQPREHAAGRKAQTLRLPPEYWRKLRIAAALRDTTQVEIVTQALDAWFAKNPLPAGVGV